MQRSLHEESLQIPPQNQMVPVQGLRASVPTVANANSRARNTSFIRTLFHLASEMILLTFTCSAGGIRPVQDLITFPAESSTMRVGVDVTLGVT